MLWAAILHECQNYLGGRGSLGGSEKKKRDCNNITAARVQVSSGRMTGISCLLTFIF